MLMNRRHKMRLLTELQFCPTSSKQRPPNRVVFCFGSFSPLVSPQRQPCARGSSDEVGTDAWFSVPLAECPRRVGKKTRRCRKAAVLTQVVAGSASRQSALRTPLAKTCHRQLFASLTQQGEPKQRPPNRVVFCFGSLSRCARTFAPTCGERAARGTGANFAVLLAEGRRPAVQQIRG